MSNLTTAAAVKEYLAITQNVTDALIASLIPRAGEQVQRYCGRKFPSETFTLTKLSGVGGRRLVLPGSPVLSVSEVQSCGVALTASSDGFVQPGYAFDDLSIYLIGGVFPTGLNNVRASWVSGYQATEDDYVATGNTPTITPVTGGNASSAVGVTYTANGTALTQVGNGPTVGQFSFSAPTFTFNSADYNHLVTLSYYYVPQNVEQAVIELVGLKLKQRTNIGVKSQGLAGENVVYEDRDMTPSIQRLLAPFVRRSYS